MLVIRQTHACIPPSNTQHANIQVHIVSSLHELLNYPHDQTCNLLKSEKNPFAHTDTRSLHTWMNTGVLMLGALPINPLERPRSIHFPILSLLFHVILRTPLLTPASATFQEWHHQLCGPSHTPTGWRDDETEREGESNGLGRANHRQRKRDTGNDGNKRGNDNLRKQKSGLNR